MWETPSCEDDDNDGDFTVESPKKRMKKHKQRSSRGRLLKRSKKAMYSQEIEYDPYADVVSNKRLTSRQLTLLRKKNSQKKIELFDSSEEESESDVEVYLVLRRRCFRGPLFPDPPVRQLSNFSDCDIVSSPTFSSFESTQPMDFDGENSISCSPPPYNEKKENIPKIHKWNINLDQKKIEKLSNDQNNNPNTDLMEYNKQLDTDKKIEYQTKIALSCKKEKEKQHHRQHGRKRTRQSIIIEDNDLDSNQTTNRQQKKNKIRESYKEKDIFAPFSLRKNNNQKKPFSQQCDAVLEKIQTATSQTLQNRNPEVSILNISPIKSGRRTRRKTQNMQIQKEQSWNCPACTFLNHGGLTSCEICNTEK